MRDWMIWLLLGGGLALAEMLSLDLVFIMLAAGAFGGAAAAGLGAPLPIQILAFAIVSVLSLFLVRPIAKKHLVQGPAMKTGTASLEGESATVLERVGLESGLIKLRGEEWTARPFDSTQTIESGEQVHVIKIQGATALVWREP